jgi:dihydrofolate reductase
VNNSGVSTHVYVGTSLDGFLARADGDIAWLVRFADDEAVAGYKEFAACIDVIVMGRGTFEKVLEFDTWPYDKPVYLMSSTLVRPPGGFEEKVTVVCQKPADLLSILYTAGFRSAYIDGGKLVQSFLAEDLIDELTVAKVPVLIGKGIPLFGSLESDIEFSHKETRVASNGLVRSYYTRLNSRG